MPGGAAPRGVARARRSHASRRVILIRGSEPNLMRSVSRITHIPVGPHSNRDGRGVRSILSFNQSRSNPVNAEAEAGGSEEDEED